MIIRDLLDKVVAFTEENHLFVPLCHVLVGVSGGADSVSLLHMLCHWPRAGLQVTAMHIHHGLRGDTADRDADFVSALCSEWGVPLVSVRADVAEVAREAGIGLEEAGRRERYRLFEETRCRLGADYILTAHTASDQAETVLMRILRGCGTDGLAGIPAVRETVRRPLLSSTRHEIETYCLENGLTYVEDETNADTAFTRNRIRHELLPLLRQINPSADTALCRLSAHAAEDSHYLCALAEEAVSAAAVPEGGYAVAAFLCQPQPVRRRMIHSVLAALALPQISESHILAVEGILRQGRGQVLLPTGVCLCVEYGRLFVLQKEESAPQNLDVKSFPFTFFWLDKQYVLRLVGAKDVEEWKNVHKMFSNYSVDYARIQDSLCIRPRRMGDVLHPAGRGVGKTLKKWMNEWHVPVVERDTLPVLCDEGGVLLVPGYACDQRACPTKDTKVFLVWQAVTE